MMNSASKVVKINNKPLKIKKVKNAMKKITVLLSKIINDKYN